MIALLTVLTLAAGISGDLRVRAEHSWPDPAGITEGLWQGNALSFYERLRIHAGPWDSVLLTEKDPGEEWGDLLTGGVSFTDQGILKVAAGALRVNLAHGLMFSHPGPFSGGDPLNLSKTPNWRLRIDLSESPGANDADPLTGAAVEYHLSDLTFSTVLGWSNIDPGSSGLHRTVSELESRRSVQEKLAVLRAGFGPVGLSSAWIRQNGDSLSTSFTRVGADFLFQTEEKDAVFTGEITSDLDSTLNFVVSGSRGLADLRHALTISRYTGNWPRSAGTMGPDHRIGAGYGVRWRPVQKVTVDAGVLILDKEEEDSYKAGVQFTERLTSRTSLTQRMKFTATAEERTFRAQITTSWSPYSDLTLSLKVPVTWYRSNSNPDENGTGLEVRLKHSPLAELDLTASASAASTGGWNSRVYAYSLSFPGEFGSKALYNSSVLLQGAVSVHISEDATLRLKGAWYSMDGAESLGSGSSETEGPSRTSAGVQLDWSF
ncbi:MAG: hypothetical protein KAH54_08640 [Candidatus Sabulitectum sp.]|nr:hypothetical protein [Candidatus Sabulitectum sp.]